MGERRDVGKSRNTNRGLMGTDNEGVLTVGVGADRARDSNGNKAGQLQLNNNK